MTDNQFFPLAAAQQNLKRLLLIRLIVFTCQVIALVYARVSGLDLSYGAIGGVLLLVVVVNIITAFGLHRQRTVSDSMFLVHLLFDVFSLTLLLYFSGGANNPFISFFLVPITISAAILPWSHTWWVAGCSLAAYTFLLFLYQPLPQLMPDAMDMAGDSGIPSLHIVGMWFNFLVSAALITYFVVKMAGEIRSREAILNRYREENLRDEQILAVATQAAGTAHELGTPLNTMAILVKEMADDYGVNPKLAEDLAVLDQQIGTCKKSLKELVRKADLRHSGDTIEMNIRDFIGQVNEQWSLIRPEVKLRLKEIGSGRAPSIVVDSTLRQAIVNILNNAADASPEEVEVQLDWDSDTWRLAVRDYGEGIDEEVVPFLGTEIISDKDQGMGVGMILSRASINRMGGQVNIISHDDRGTVMEISLPVVRREA